MNKGKKGTGEIIIRVIKYNKKILMMLNQAGYKNSLSLKKRTQSRAKL